MCKLVHILTGRACVYYAENSEIHVDKLRILTMVSVVSGKILVVSGEIRVVQGKILAVVKSAGLNI